MKEHKKHKILFIIVEDRYFLSHRLHLAQYAIKKGYQVGLLCKISKHKEFLENEGIQVFDWSLVRGSFNLFFEIKAIYEILITLLKFAPDVLHAVALKPVIYASFASKLVFLKSRVFALGGLGFIFSSDKILAKLLRPLIVLVLKFTFSGNKSRLIIQNIDDKRTLINLKVIRDEKIDLIKGAGVDMKIFSFIKEPSQIPEVILPARLLWDKGVGEFVLAADILKKRGINAKFTLLGETDPHNPECIPDDQIEDWKKEGAVDVAGFQDDMAKCIQDCAVVCLPSYREGLPKSLLEAASCGRPIVTTDVPGCREIVQDGVNGYLVPSKNPDLLAEALSRLLTDRKLREVMGLKGREFVERGFSAEIVAIKTEKIWNSLLN
jgi:glycosyltransferase involved in cell wall biosynthesis